MENINHEYLIRVADYMKLPRPKHKSRFIVNYGEILPIILVECEVWKHAATANMQTYTSHISRIPGVIHTAVKDMGNVKLIRVVMILNWLED